MEVAGWWVEHVGRRWLCVLVEDRRCGGKVRVGKLEVAGGWVEHVGREVVAREVLGSWGGEMRWGGLAVHARATCSQVVGGRVLYYL